MKLVEMEELIGGNEREIICITETQQRRGTVFLSDGNQMMSKMREIGDKKGGGLCVLWRESNEFVVREIETTHTDLLAIQIQVHGVEYILVLVYFSTGNSERVRNNKLEVEIRRLSEENEDKCLVILGDLNGPVGFLGTQVLDENGRKLLSLVEEYNLKILNMEDECRDRHTWQRGEQHSVIDFVLCNEPMYKYFNSMTIDQEKEVIDFSDHNLITATAGFNIVQGNGRQKNVVDSYLK